MRVVTSTVFQPPEDKSRRLSLSEFIAVHREFTSAATNRITKLERLQSYQEPGNPSYEAFMDGQKELAISLIPDMRAQEADFYTQLFRRGVQFLRIRAVEFPLSDYLKWEFQTYPVSALYGETIVVTDISDETPSSPLQQTSDFLLYDEHHVFVHDYSSDGFLTGGWLSEDASYIASCVQLAKGFLAKSVPLAVFEKQFKNVL